MAYDDGTMRSSFEFVQVLARVAKDQVLLPTPGPLSVVSVKCP